MRRHEFFNLPQKGAPQN